ncbi:glutamate racemase [Alicyclobacillus shizuokensis]|uniref:glutamate racemase n=1 Tax=Alicyclobacillus shizuokensis TaxID=392014 RepID=UPI00082C6C96|nr:glutamate racemase [Alicyclobacillus shizuokensis]MCL6625807.1 glutamate racemase [Alicyclobacillus shizuokensis]
MHVEQPIAVFDSGIGGLTVVSEIMSVLPDEAILYFGDTARCPYGDRDPDEVLEFSLQIADFLLSQQVKLLVVACNTATAVALPELQQRSPIPVLGVIQPGARAAVNSATPRRRRIGVIGTAVTIASGAYADAVHVLDSSIDVVSLACPQFVPLVESGRWDGADVEQVVRESLLPLLLYDIDALILGCTHYPLLSSPIARVVGPEVQLISSAAETAREVRGVLARQRLLRPSGDPPIHQFYTTGDEQKMEVAVQDWLGLPADRARVRCVDPMVLHAR